MKNWLIAVGMTLGVAACGGKGDAPASGKAEHKLSGEAAAKWDTLCVTCHGKTGAGDGAGAAGLNPKPRSFGDAEWQKKVTDDHLRKVIIEGGQAVQLSNLMPGNPDLKNKPAVVDELVKKIRSFGP